MFTVNIAGTKKENFSNKIIIKENENEIKERKMIRIGITIATRC